MPGGLVWGTNVCRVCVVVCGDNWWINHSTPGTIRPPELCYFKHEYEAGVGRRFSCYNRICHDVGGRACGGVSVLVRDGTTHSQITLNTTLHCGLRQLIWCC